MGGGHYYGFCEACGRLTHRKHPTTIWQRLKWRWFWREPDNDEAVRRLWASWGKIWPPSPTASAENADG